MLKSSETSSQGSRVQVDETLLAIIDRLIEPVRTQFHTMDLKLDRALAIGERVATQEQLTSSFTTELAALKSVQESHKEVVNTIKGRNQVILWMLGIVGAPIAVLMISAGLASMFGLKLL
jgi:hypothetical protein